MTAVRIVIPADPLEARRFVARLAHAGVSQENVAARSISDGTVARGRVLGGMSGLARAAALGGDGTALDSGDLEYQPQPMNAIRAGAPLMPSVYPTSWADGRMRANIGRIEAGIVALQSPNARSWVSAMTALRLGLEQADSTTGIFDDIATCSRTQFERYRALLPRLAAALTNARVNLRLSSDDATDLERSLRSAQDIVERSLGRQLAVARLGLGAETCATDWTVPLLGWRYTSSCERNFALSAP